MRKLLLSVALIGGLALPGNMAAQGIPVIDGSSLGKLIEQMNQMLRDYDVQTNQLGTLQAQLTNGLSQLENLKSQLRSLIEGSGVGKLLASAEDFKKLKGLIDDPLAALQGISSGSFASGFSANGNGADLAKQALESVGITPDMLGAMSSSPALADRNLAQSAGASAMLSAAGQSSNLASAASLDRIQQMVGLIDGQAGVKSAIDLNTRITAELGIILIQMWRLEAAQGVSMGQIGAADEATIAAERKFRAMAIE